MLERFYAALSRLVEKKVKIYEIFGQEITNETITYDYLLRIAGFNHGNDRTIKFLLDKGASPNVTNSYGTDLLNYSVRNHRVNQSLLIEKGAKLDVIDIKDGMTPLMRLVSFTYRSQENLMLAELLIKQGACLDLHYDNDQTLLKRAIFLGHDEIAKLLIENGVEINRAGPDDEESPLMTALGLGRIKIAELLIEKGADTDFKNKDGQSPKMFLAQKIFLEEDAAKKEEMKKLFIDLLKKKKPDVSEEEVEQQLKLYLAEMMLTIMTPKN